MQCPRQGILDVGIGWMADQPQLPGQPFRQHQALGRVQRGRRLHQLAQLIVGQCVQVENMKPCAGVMGERARFNVPADTSACKQGVSVVVLMRAFARDKPGHDVERLARSE